MATQTEDQKDKQDRWSATQVYNTCEKMQQVERLRAYDRALINGQFNGGRPYTDAEVRAYQIHINVNFGEGKNILLQAVNQLNNALIFKEQFFTCTSKGGPTEKKQDYGDVFTRNIHEPLKSGLSGQRQMFLLMNRNLSVALHGPGAILWMNGFRWRGRFIGLEDLLIPTDALCDFSNLMFFAANLYLTAGEFFDMTHSDKVDSRWDIEACRKILNDLVKPGHAQQESYNYQDRPEQWVEWMKQNRVMWDIDAASTVQLRTFFYKDPRTKKWHRCVMLKDATKDQSADNQSFLYDGRNIPFADSVNHVLHVQYGDNNVVAPKKYHSVRGLGVDLYSPVECNNRLRCEFTQHVLFQLKTLLKINNPTDRDRPKMMDLSNYSVLEDGVEMVPNTMRYQVPAELVQAALSQMKQIMGEAGSGYVKDVESGTSQPRTATETNALVGQAQEQISNMLQSMYAQEEFYWEEIVRRFCDKESEDDEVKEFRKQCIADGIPETLIKASNWKVKIERALGGGDHYTASQEASMLLSNSQRYDPRSQRIILKKWTNTITRDPKMGELLVPDNQDKASDGTIAAEDVFGTLMEGIPVSIREGIERTDYIESVLGMTKNKIQQIMQTEGVPTMPELTGLQACLNHVQQNLQILEQDPSMKPQVKQYSDLLSQLMNEVKMLGERFSEQQKADNPGADPAMQAKVEGTKAMAQTKQQIAQSSAAQKMQMREAEFEQKIQQREKEFQSNMAQEIATFRAEMLKFMTETNAGLIADGTKARSDIKIAEARSKEAPKPVEK